MKPLMIAVLAWLAMVSPSRASHPNILLIVSEDNGPELGCYGDTCARTPRLDQLAREGVRFENAYTTQAGCSQSRASFLTGLYPHQHGQIGLATWGFRLSREDIPNLPRNLKNVGYRTGIIGKLHVNPESAFPFDFQAIPESNFARKKLSDYSRKAKQFMTSGDAPFFLSVNFPDAHDPWHRQIDGLPERPQSGTEVRAMPYLGVDPPEMRGHVANYYNCMARLDSLVGDLLDALAASGKAGNTLVVYLGDHGADMLRGKRTSYEGGVRIPLIIRWPGRIAPRVSEDLVCTIDLMPTFLEAAGASPVAGLPGKSLLPLLQRGAPLERTYLFTEFHTHAAVENYFPQRTVRNRRYKLIENLLPDQVNPGYDYTLKRDLPGAAAAIEGAPDDIRAAYHLMRQPPRFELYDLQSDPYEFHSLTDSPAHASVLAELRQALTDWRTSTKDPLLDAAHLESLTAEMAGRIKRKLYTWNSVTDFHRDGD